MGNLVARAQGHLYIYIYIHIHIHVHTYTYIAHQNPLHHTATLCNTLQHTATLCNTPQHTGMLHVESLVWASICYEAKIFPRLAGSLYCQVIFAKEPYQNRFFCKKVLLFEKNPIELFCKRDLRPDNIEYLLLAGPLYCQVSFAKERL